MSDLRIESVVPSDADVLREIGTAAFQADFEEYGSRPPGIDSPQWHADLGATEHYFKILVGGELAGAIGLIPDGTTGIEVKIFFIDDRFQGGGIGSRVMSRIEQRYPQIERWYLVTPYRAFRNHHFYEKLGYRKVGEVQPDPGRDFRVFEYVKTR